MWSPIEDSGNFLNLGTSSLVMFQVCLTVLAWECTPDLGTTRQRTVLLTLPGPGRVGWQQPGLTP